MRGILKAVLMLTLFASANASAIVINTLNDPIEFTISGDIGSGVVLAASGTVTVTSGLTGSLLVLHVNLNNASTLNGQPYTPADGVLLTGWGFGVDPAMTGVTFADGAEGGMIDAAADFIPGISGIEVCAWGGNACSGGIAGGISAGGSDSFDLQLDGNWRGFVTFDPIGAQFLTPGGSFSFECSGSCTGPGAAAAAVPEPQTLALLLLGMVAVGIGRKPSHRQHPVRR